MFTLHYKPLYTPIDIDPTRRLSTPGPFTPPHPSALPDYQVDTVGKVG